MAVVAVVAAKPGEGLRHAVRDGVVAHQQRGELRHADAVQDGVVAHRQELRLADWPARPSTSQLG